MSLRACPAAAALFALCAASAATAEPFALVPAYDQIYRVDLATRKCVETTQKREFVAAFDPEDFRICGIGVLPEKNNCCGVFRRG